MLTEQARKQFVEWGKLGLEKSQEVLKQKYGENFYSEMGKKGSARAKAVLEAKYGKDWASVISKKRWAK